MASVSVVIPCYNKASYLRQTLDSVLAQTCPPSEVLVIDDGSDDESSEIAARYGPPIRLIRQDNRGESSARNRGIQEAGGDWIALLDADDVWEPDKLERQFRGVEESGRDIVCVYSDVFLFNDQGERIGEHRRPEYHAEADYRVKMLVDWSINTSSAVVRASALGDVRFPEDIRDSEDLIFFLQLRERGDFLRIPECLVGYRRNEANQTATLWHFPRSVAARFDWFLRNQQLFSRAEDAQVRELLAEQLRYPHDVALSTTRDTRLVKACRRLYDTIRPHTDSRPSSFSRSVYPRWAYWLRDRASRFLRYAARVGRG